MTNQGRTLLWTIVLSTLFVVAIIALLVYLDVQDDILRLLQWLEAQGIWALVWFTLIMALVVVFLLPGVFFTTGAGFVFGVVEGSICVVLGTTLGATAAFLIARYLFGERARQYVLARSKLRFISDEIAPHGGKIVLLTRLIPFFPAKLANYFFGLTPFSLRGYVWGTFIGIIPFSVHNVYLGSMAADITGIGTRGVSDRSPLEWSLYAAGFIALVVVIVYLNRLSRRALAKYMEQEKGEQH